MAVNFSEIHGNLKQILPGNKKAAAYMTYTPNAGCPVLGVHIIVSRFLPAAYVRGLNNQRLSVLEV